MRRKPIVGITMGDPVGIGSEIIVKTLSSKKVYNACRPLVIGDSLALNQITPRCEGLKLEYKIVKDVGDCLFGEGFPEVLDLANLPRREIPWGNPALTVPLRRDYAGAAIEYVEKAVELCLNGAIDAMATAPINKGEALKAGLPFTGHTELLAGCTGAKSYAMMLVGAYRNTPLRVVLATTHVPLSEVSPGIKKERIIELLRLINRSLPLFGVGNPRIGVAALNPHGGEEGEMGVEETEELKPAIEIAVKEGIRASGPYPADTLFLPSNRERYDVFLAMYHDQGLIPLKAQSFLSAVNITLGLPLIRTSVSHGTAYDIAGKGVADPLSLINAVVLAAKLASDKNK